MMRFSLASGPQIEVTGIRTKEGPGIVVFQTRLMPAGAHR